MYGVNAEAEEGEKAKSISADTCTETGGLFMVAVIRIVCSVCKACSF